MKIEDDEDSDSKEDDFHCMDKFRLQETIKPSPFVVACHKDPTMLTNWSKFRGDINSIELRHLKTAGLARIGRFSEAEDEKIRENWRQICQSHRCVAENPGYYLLGFSSIDDLQARKDHRRFVRDNEIVERLCDGIEGRPLRRIYWHARRILDPNRQWHELKFFSREEDKRLLRLVRKFGTNWTKIGQIMGHSRTAVNDRYYTHVMNRAAELEETLDETQNGPDVEMEAETADNLEDWECNWVINTLMERSDVENLDELRQKRIHKDELKILNAKFFSFDEKKNFGK